MFLGLSLKEAISNWRVFAEVLVFDTICPTSNLRERTRESQDERKGYGNTHSRAMYNR